MLTLFPTLPSNLSRRRPSHSKINSSLQIYLSDLAQEREKRIPPPPLKRMTILRIQICVTESCLSFSEVREFSDENLSEFAGKSFGIAGREKLSTKSATNIHRHVHTRLAHLKLFLSRSSPFRAVKSEGVTVLLGHFYRAHSNIDMCTVAVPPPPPHTHTVRR